MIAALSSAVTVGWTLQAQSTRPVAAIYRGPASCSGCSEAVAALVRQSPHGFEVRYIGPDERMKLTAANLRGVSLYAQPGGDGSVGRAEKALGPKGTGAIKNYVSSGGNYVGFCMGAYLAGFDPGMGMLSPGNTGGYIHTRGASVKSARDTVIPIDWKGDRRHHFAPNPSYIIPSEAEGERILSRFTNGRVNSLVKPYGKGGVGVVGTHPEAGRAWYGSELWRKDKDGMDSAQGLRLIHQTMRF